MNIPERALYLCHFHGIFSVETFGILFRYRTCRHATESYGGWVKPCGVLSPLLTTTDGAEGLKLTEGVSVRDVRAYFQAMKELEEANIKNSIPPRGNIPFTIKSVKEIPVDGDSEERERSRFLEALNETWEDW